MQWKVSFALLPQSDRCIDPPPNYLTVSFLCFLPDFLYARTSKCKIASPYTDNCTIFFTLLCNLFFFILYYLLFPETVYRRVFSAFSTSSVVCCLLIYGHSHFDKSEMVSPCGLICISFMILMLSIFLYVYWPCVCPLWRSVYSGPLSIFNSVVVVVLSFVFCKFWILSSYQVYRQMCSPIIWVVILLMITFAVQKCF